MAIVVVRTESPRVVAKKNERREGRLYPPPHEEGWLRYQENFGEAHLKRRRRGGRSRATFGCERPPRPLH